MKPKVALLRGLGRESGHWDPEFLTLMNSHYDLILLDYPGSGAFLQDTFPNSIEQVLMHLNKQIRTKEPIFLVAVSLGGMVALEWAKNFPEKFSGMVLINSSAKDLSPFYKRMSAAAMLSVTKAIANAKTPQKSEQEIVAIVANNKSKYSATIENWTQIAKQRPTSLKNVAKQLWMAAHFHSPKAPLSVPLQFLVSEQDRFVDPSCSKNLALKYGAPLASHNTGGHDLVIDDPHWVSEQIQLFIRRRTTA